MMVFPKMRVVVLLEGAECTIDVVHHAAQSWSRSVDPRASKEARRVLRDGRQWAWVDTEYGRADDGDMCVSRYFYKVVS